MLERLVCSYQKIFWLFDIMEQVFREVKEKILKEEGDVYVAALCVSIQACLVQKQASRVLQVASNAKQ